MKLVYMYMYIASFYIVNLIVGSSAPPTWGFGTDEGLLPETIVGPSMWPVQIDKCI